MCKAELNLSVLPCRHRWYHLAEPCSPGRHLSNCGDKLALTGWEIKCDFCPFCARWSVNGGESYRLIGDDHSSGSQLTRTPSASLSMSSATRRDSRRDSLARSDVSTGSSASGGNFPSLAISTSPYAIAASEKNRAQNSRLDAYLATTSPVLASTGPYRYSRTYMPPTANGAMYEDDAAMVDGGMVPSRGGRSTSDYAAESPDESTAVAANPRVVGSRRRAGTTDSSEADRRKSNRLSRSWDKSKRLSKGFFK